METPIRFASYELDPVAGELRKAGVRVRLAGQPLDVLALLASRPGEVVTREELKQALWTEDTFVDFDDGLNSAIRRIRRALDDSATSPRFIETLPKRGYRFIETVEGQGSGGSPTGADRRRRTWAYVVGGLSLAALSVWLADWPTEQDAQTATEPSNVRPLTSLPGVEQHPSFSPDGSQVAFSWNGADRQGFDIYVQSVAGGEPRRLTTDPADEASPAWSPDGKWIAFWRSEGDRGGVHLVSPVGGGTRKLFDDRPDLVSNFPTGHQLSWSADGKWLAFADSLTDPNRITAVSIEGVERPLTAPGAGVVDSAPAFSADGKQLAWKRWYGPGAAIFTMRLPDGEPVPRIEAAGGVGFGLVWAADSRSLVVEGGHGNSLLELDLESDIVRTVQNTLPAAQPAISKDGLRLAFTAVGRDSDVLRVDLAAGSPQPATHQPFFASTRFEFAPQISPDGSRVALSSWRTGDRVLWTMMADQSQPAPIAERGAAPRWSPDGRAIAFGRGLRPDDEGYGVWTVDADGGPAKLLTNPNELAHQPCWSSDGETIYYTRKDGADLKVFKKAASGEGEATAVTRGKGERCWVNDGWVYFGRDADVLRTPVGGGREEMVLEGRLFAGSAHWQVLDGMLYFIDFEEGLRAEHWMLKRMNLVSRSMEEVVELPTKPRQQNGLSVAPDQSWFLYTVDNVNEQDLMMIEGFQ